MVWPVEARRLRKRVGRRVSLGSSGNALRPIGSKSPICLPGAGSARHTEFEATPLVSLRIRRHGRKTPEVHRVAALPRWLSSGS